VDVRDAGIHKAVLLYGSALRSIRQCTPNLSSGLHLAGSAEWVIEGGGDRRMAVVNLLLAPFLLVFLLIYFFLRHAEKFYHSPSSLGARRWSPLASWKLREFNELPYYVRHRFPLPHI